MESYNKTDLEFEAGDSLILNFSYGNRTVETRGHVKMISSDDDIITLQLDISDKKMTLPPGTDIYVLKKGILLNIVDSTRFPEVDAIRVSRRNHARVDDVLKINYQGVAPERYHENANTQHTIFEESFGETYKIPDMEDLTLKTIYEILYQLNQKIDYIMDKLDCEYHSQYSSPVYEHVNISASGMRFNTEHTFEIGDIVALRLFLPLATKNPLDVLGEIVTVSDSEVAGRQKVSVKFRDMAADDEELITKYVFKRQRELLRGQVS